MRHLLALLSTFYLLSATNTLQAQPPSYVPTNGLVGWWPFNGNANDESGNGNNGTVNGPVLVSDRNGNVTSAYSYDGVDDRIEVDHNDILNCSEVSISVWFKTTTFVASNSLGPHLLSKRQASGWGNSYQMNIGINQGQNACWADWSINGNSGIYYNNTQALTTEVWYHLVYTHDADNVRLYLNGTEVESISSPGILSSNDIPLWFGARPNAGNNSSWFNGVIDDVGIWSRSLTSAEVQTMYSAQPVAPCISATEVSFSGLSTSYTTSDTPVSLVGIPVGGIFIGSGITGNSFDPAAAGEGTHGISYVYADEDGCLNASSLCTAVSVGMGVEPGDDAVRGVRVFPNPSRGEFTLELELIGLVGLWVFDARGSLVHNEVFSTSGNRTQRIIDLSTFSKGSYTLLVEHEGHRVSQTVVVR